MEKRPLKYEIVGEQYKEKLNKFSDFSTNGILELANFKEDQTDEVCLNAISEWGDFIKGFKKEKSTSLVRDYRLLEDVVALLHGLYIHFFETKRGPIKKEIQDQQKNMLDDLERGYTLLGYSVNQETDGSLLVTNRDTWKDNFSFLTIGKEEIQMRITYQNLNQDSQELNMLGDGQKQPQVFVPCVTETPEWKNDLGIETGAVYDKNNKDQQ